MFCECSVYVDTRLRFRGFRYVNALIDPRSPGQNGVHAARFMRVCLVRQRGWPAGRFSTLPTPAVSQERMTAVTVRSTVAAMTVEAPPIARGRRPHAGTDMKSP